MIFITVDIFKHTAKKNKKIKQADQILPEVYGTTLNMKMIPVSYPIYMYILNVFLLHMFCITLLWWCCTPFWHHILTWKKLQNYYPLILFTNNLFVLQPIIYHFDSMLMGGTINVSVISKEIFEDTKGAIRNRISKKNRQNNGQK